MTKFVHEKVIQRKESPIDQRLPEWKRWSKGVNGVSYITKTLGLQYGP